MLAGGFFNLLAQAGLTALWPLMLAVKYVRDPVVWVALAMVALMRPAPVLGMLRYQAARLKALRCRLASA